MPSRPQPRSANLPVVGLGTFVSAFAVLFGIAHLIGALRGNDSPRDAAIWGAVGLVGAVGLGFGVPWIRRRLREEAAALTPQEAAQSKVEMRSVWLRGGIFFSLGFGVVLASDGARLIGEEHRVIGWILVWVGGLFAVGFLALLGVALRGRLRRRASR